jgi:histidyl-tRNA synthetase
VIAMAFEKAKGTRDFSPQEMSLRNYVFDTIRRVYKTYGYQELETPAFERWETLSAKSAGGEDVSKEIFRFTDYGEREMGLRFDLTVPMARYIANNPMIPRPFKRFQIGRVWRYDQPQAGRYREFWQADVDVVGSTEVEADLDALGAVVASLKALGFKDFTVEINNRALLEELAELFEIPRVKCPDLFRCIDKLDKIGMNSVKKEIADKGIKNVDKFLKFIETSGMKELEEKLPESAELAKTKELLKASKALGLGKWLKLTLSMVRGLAYYTSFVFEIKVKGMEKYGSVGAGGRYDDLIGVYGKSDMPATGCSIGVERIIEIMKERKMVDIPKTETKVLVIPIGNTFKDAAKIVQQLRDAGIPSTIDLMKRGPSKLFSYANSLGIPYSLAVGEKEVNSKKYTLKNMESGKQEELGIDKIISKLSN